MKNITVSVKDELYYRARLKAAENRSTVSAMVREFLTQMVEESPNFARLQREQNDLIARIRESHAGFSAAERVSREKVHIRGSHAVR
jgi:plasmid stability protein